MLTINSNIQKFEKIINKGYELVNNIWEIEHLCIFKKCSGKSNNGKCRKLDLNRYEISINENLVNEEDVLEVVVHELLHSYPDVFSQGHKGEWKIRASKIYKEYGIKVQRTNSFLKIIPENKVRKEYYFECFNCNRTWTYHKHPKWYKDIENVKCPHCKTKSIVEFIKGDTIIL